MARRDDELLAFRGAAGPTRRGMSIGRQNRRRRSRSRTETAGRRSCGSRQHECRHRGTRACGALRQLTHAGATRRRGGDWLAAGARVCRPVASSATVFAARRRSYVDRARVIRDMCASAQAATCRIGSSSERPSAVSSYSTRGGTSANALRVTTPSRSRLRSVCVRTFGATPPIRSRRWLNRCGPSSSVRTTSTVHLSPILSRTARVGQCGS